MDTNSYIQRLLQCNPIREASDRGVKPSTGSCGLDAGCGISLQCLQFAEEVGSTGHLTGLDMLADMLDYGRKITEEIGSAEQISFKQGDLINLPLDDNTFDWVQSNDCVGYASLETLHLLKEMAMVLKPGGIVAIAAQSFEKLLPGYPCIEARLGATSYGIAPFIQDKRPELHFQGALGWFHKLGLTQLPHFEVENTFINIFHVQPGNILEKS